MILYKILHFLYIFVYFSHFCCSLSYSKAPAPQDLAEKSFLYIFVPAKPAATPTQHGRSPALAQALAHTVAVRLLSKPTHGLCTRPCGSHVYLSVRIRMLIRDALPILLRSSGCRAGGFCYLWAHPVVQFCNLYCLPASEYC